MWNLAFYDSGKNLCLSFIALDFTPHHLCLQDTDDIVHMYLPPEDVFYDFFTGARATNTGWHDVTTPLDAINVHIRGGSILVQQEPGVTTTAS